MLRISTPLTLLTLLSLAGGCDDADKSADEPTPAKSETKSEEAPAKVADADDVKAPADEAAPAEADEDAPADDAAPEDAEADDDAVEAPAAEATPVEPGKPGPAYFAVRDKGLVMLDAGTFTKVEGGPDKLVHELQPGPDGGIYLLGFEGILKLEGAKAQLVAPVKLGGATGSLDDFATTKDGQFWAVGFKGVSHWDGSSWSTDPKTDLGPDVTLVRSVAVDGEDRVWVTSANALHLREGETWTTVDTGKIFKRKAFYEDVGIGPEGIAYAIGSSKMLKLTAPDAIETIKIGDRFAMLSDLHFSQTGVGGLRTSLDVVTRVGVDGNKTKFKAGKDFAADRIIDVTPDDSGRLWIATDAGVAIVGPDDERVEWRSGSIDELAGQVEVIGVAGSGPELPGEVGPVKTGGIKGKVLKGGAGLASATVEICPKPSSYFRRSPCAESPTRRTAETDADGNFEMTDVPLGAYGLAVKVGKKWQLTFGSEYGAGMKEGETYDIGSITLNEDS